MEASFVTIETYLHLLKEDPGSVPNEDHALFEKLEEVLKEYKSLDCVTCGTHFGYQHRRDPNAKVCSSRCLASLDQKLKPQRSVGLDDSLTHVETCPIPDTPASPDPEPEPELEPEDTNAAEFHPPTSHVSTFCEVSKPQEPQTPKLVPVAVTLKANKKSQDKNKKKIWNLDDVSLSPTLVDKAPCVVSFSWGKGKFTVAAESDLAQMEKLQSDIAEYVHGDGAPALKSRDRMPRANEIVFAPYEEDFYRGRVVKASASKGMLFVDFIDYGDSKAVNLEDCFEPSDKIMMEHPMYGLTFTLKTTVPFPQDLVYKPKLKQFIDDAKFYLRTDGPEPSKLDWVGTLQLESEVKGKKTLNALLDQFIMKKTESAPKSPEPVAKSQEPAAADVPPTPTTAQAEVKQLSESAAPIAPKVKEVPAPEPEPVSPAVETPEIKSKESAAPASATKVAAPAPASSPSPAIRRPTNPFTEGSKLTKTIHNSVVSPNIKHGAWVRINYVWNDALICICCVEDEAAIASLDEAIAKHVETAPGLTSMPDMDEIVLAPYLGLYYRGRVTSLEGDEVKVRFVDYGADFKGHYKSLKGLNSEIAELPIYGTDFRMADVPETKNFTCKAHPEIAAALESGGQIEVIETGEKLPGELTGNLWLNETRSWIDVVLEIMEA